MKSTSVGGGDARARSVQALSRARLSNVSTAYAARIVCQLGQPRLADPIYGAGQVLSCGRGSRERRSGARGCHGLDVWPRLQPRGWQRKPEGRRARLRSRRDRARGRRRLRGRRVRPVMRGRRTAADLRRRGHPRIELRPGLSDRPRLPPRGRGVRVRLVLRLRPLVRHQWGRGLAVRSRCRQDRWGPADGWRWLRTVLRPDSSGLLPRRAVSRRHLVFVGRGRRVRWSAPRLLSRSCSCAAATTLNRWPPRPRRPHPWSRSLPSPWCRTQARPP
jgi:hypothetical protein